MRKFVRFHHGKRIYGVHCPFCDMKRNGVVLREDIYWKKMLDCGHKIGRSFVLPPHELVRLGFVNRNYEDRDPRALARINSEIQDGIRIIEERKRKKWLDENLAGGKRYL